MINLDLGAMDTCKRDVAPVVTEEVDSLSPSYGEAIYVVADTPDCEKAPTEIYSTFSW